MPITVSIGAGNAGTAAYIMQDFKTEYENFEEGLELSEEGKEYHSKYFENPRENMSPSDIKNYVNEITKSSLPSRKREEDFNEEESIKQIVNESVSVQSDELWMESLRELVQTPSQNFSRETALVMKRLDALQKIQESGGAFQSREDMVKFLAAPTTSYTAIGKGGLIERDANILTYLTSIAPQIEQKANELSKRSKNRYKKAAVHLLHGAIDAAIAQDLNAKRMIAVLDEYAGRNHGTVTSDDVSKILESNEFKFKNEGKELVREAFEKAVEKEDEKEAEKEDEIEETEVNVFSLKPEIEKNVEEISMVNMDDEDAENEKNRWIDSINQTKDDSRGYVREVEFSMKPEQQKIYDGLNDEQKDFIESATKGENIFISGGAGTGKTYTVNAYIENFVPEGTNVLRMATTGKAAENIDGVTIHRGFNIPVGNGVDLDRMEVKPSEALVHADAVVIDECGMMDAKTMNYVARSIKEAERISGRPKQLILSGDFLQLPPVNKEGKVEWGFESEGWKQLKMHPVVLKTVVRQADLETATNLNQIRVGDGRNIEYFNLHCHNNLKVPESSIRIVPTNEDVNAVNEKYLENAKANGAEIHTFISKSTGCEEGNISTLKVWEGARVICTQNDRNQKFVNGAMGTVEKINPGTETITVKLENGNTVEISPQTTKTNDYTYNDKNRKINKITVGTTTEIPLKLGYAITVHKSQGQTYNNVIVDPKSFSAGQLYVALSRCRTVNGMKLTQPIKKEWVKADAEAVSFYKEATSYGNARTYHGVDRQTAARIYPRTVDGHPKLVSGIGCNPDTCKKDFQAVRDAFGKSGEKETVHMVLSHTPEVTDPQLVHAMAKEVVEKSSTFKGHQVVIATHMDRPSHLHSHILVNTTSMENGKKLQMTTKTLQEFKDVSNKVAMEHGINPMVVGFNHQLEAVTEKSMGRGEFAMHQRVQKAVAEKSVKALSQAEITKFAIDFQSASRTAKSFKEFKKLMNEKGHWCEFHFEGRFGHKASTLTSKGREEAKYYLERGDAKTVQAEFAPKSKNGINRTYSSDEMANAVKRQSGLKIDFSIEKLRENIQTNRIAAGLEPQKTSEQLLTEKIENCIEKADSMAEFKDLMEKEGIKIIETHGFKNYDLTDWNKCSSEVAETKRELQDMYQTSIVEQFHYMTTDGNYSIGDYDLKNPEKYSPDGIRNCIEEKIKEKCEAGELSATVAQAKISNLHKEEVESRKENLTEVDVRKLFAAGKIGRIQANKLSREVHAKMAHSSKAYNKTWAKSENYLFTNRKKFADGKVLGYGKQLEKIPQKENKVAEKAKVQEKTKVQEKSNGREKARFQLRNKSQGRSVINHSKSNGRSY